VNAFETTMEPWHDYYVAAGGAAAVLLGLLFVSLSSHLDREASAEYEMLHRVGTQTIIDLGYALGFVLVMLMPISDPRVLGGVLLVLSLVGGQDLWGTRQHEFLSGWTHYVSVGGFAVLLLGAVALLFGAWGVGVYFVGAAIWVLILAGTRNTWGLLIRARERGSNR
jgi:hypothetical protein